MPRAGNKIRSGFLGRAFSRAQKRAEMLGHMCIMRGSHNVQRGEQNQKWLPHPCLLGGSKEGTNATSPLHSRRSPTLSAGNKIRSGYLTHAFSGAQKRAEMLRHLCIMRGPTTPSAGNKIRSGYLTPTFSGAQKRAEMLHHPCILGGPQCQERGTISEVAFWPVPSRGPERGQKCSVTCAL
jgi:hypothetical protein